LLSGDNREVEKMWDAPTDWKKLLRDAKQKANSSSNGQPSKKFNSTKRVGHVLRNPADHKRKQVDGGNVTVAELQIFYLQQDAASWVKNPLRLWT